MAFLDRVLFRFQKFRMNNRWRHSFKNRIFRLILMTRTNYFLAVERKATAAAANVINFVDNKDKIYIASSNISCSNS